MNIGKKKILLSLSTHLYAPIYLAKYYNLYGAFDNIVLEHLSKSDFELQISSFVFDEDPAMRRLRNESDVIGIVGDPGRSVFTESKYYKGIILCTPVVKLPHFWLANPINESGDVEYIVSHPKGMTAHRLALDYLSKRYAASDLKPRDRIIEAPKPGYEKDTFLKASGINNRLKWLRPLNPRIGYITSDPTLADQNDLKMVDSFTDVDKSVITALISHEDKIKSPADRDVIENISNAIYAAIILMRRNPPQSASDLFRDEVSHPVFLEYTKTSDRTKARMNISEFLNNHLGTLDDRPKGSIFFNSSNITDQTWDNTKNNSNKYYDSFGSDMIKDEYQNNISDFVSTGLEKI